MPNCTLDRTKLLFLLVFTVAIKLALFIFPVHPVHNIQDDSLLFFNLGEKILHYDLDGFEGGKPPGYSLFIILSLFNVRKIILYQLIIGFIIVLLIYRICRCLTNIPYIPLLAGFLYAIYLPALRSELSILSETLTAFLVSLSFFLLLQTLIEKKSRPILIVSLASFAGLTRPEYVFLPFVIIAFLLYIQAKKGFSDGIRLRKIVIVALVPILLFLGWCVIVYRLTGEFTLSTGRSFGIMEILGDSVLDAPDTAEFALLKKEYLEAKAKLLDCQEDPKEAMSVAASNVRKKLCLNLKETEDLVFSMAIKIIKERPIDYLKKAICNWIIFWKPDTIKMAYPDKKYFNYMDKTVTELLRKGLLILSNAEKYFYMAINLLFLLSPIIIIIQKKSNQYTEFSNIFFLIYFFIIGISLIIAFVEGCEERFSLPIYPLLLSVTLSLYGNIILDRRNSNA